MVISLLFVSLLFLSSHCCTEYSQLFATPGSGALCMTRTIDDDLNYKMKVRHCNESESCTYGPGESENCKKTTNIKYLPGRTCANNTECISNVCNAEKKVCKGFASGQACNYSSECDVGTACISNVCKTLLAAKELNCETTPCRLGLICANNTCMKPGSVKNGKESPIGILCESFFAQGGKCQIAPKSAEAVIKAKWVCGDNELCQSDKPGFEEICTCGMTGRINKTCNKQPGDVNMGLYFSYAISMADSAEQKCHISEDEGVLCMYKNKIENMGKEYASAYVAFYEGTQFSKYAENPEYIKLTINKKYWDAKKSSEEDSKFGLYLFLGIAIGAVFVIAVLLLVIYFKRRKGDDTEEGTTKLT